MGGYGSGVGIRPNATRNKGFVEQCRWIDAREFPFALMQRVPPQGWQASAHNIPLRVLKDRLEVHHGHDQANKFYKIPFSLSLGNFGSYRYWLQCPNQSCGRRSRKLYLVRDAREIPCFLCRVCLNLAYKSQNKSALDRLIDKKWKTVAKLGWKSPDSGEIKPKGMHRKTFEELKTQIAQLDTEITYGIDARFHGG